MKVSQLIRFSLKQLLTIGVGEEPTAEEMADALFLLNAMMHDWRNENVDVQHQNYVLTDDVAFWVPPRDADGATIDAAALQGGWDAATNTPALVSGAGVNGNLYKVSVAGSTLLDGVANWSIGDYLVFDGQSRTWMKGRSSQQLEHGIAALLAVRLATYFSMRPADELVVTAERSWRQILAAYVKAPIVGVDDALVRLSSNRYAAY